MALYRKYYPASSDARLVHFENTMQRVLDGRIGRQYQLINHRNSEDCRISKLDHNLCYDYG